MNNYKIFNLILSVALSVSLVVVCGFSYAADTKPLGPVKSPLSKTTSKEQSVTGANTKSLSPASSTTTKSLNRNALSQPARNSAKQQTLTPGGVSSASGPATYIRTITDTRNHYPIAGMNTENLAQGFSAVFINYKKSIYTYNRERSRCIIKPYSSAEKAQAGCTSTMSVRACEERLVFNCARPYTVRPKELYRRLLGMYPKVEKAMTSIEQHDWGWQPGR